MDNDNKIDNKSSGIHKRHDEVLLFLDEELKNLQKGSNQDVYDIKKEYAKTKNNKSPFTILVLVATTVVLLATALIITKVVSKQNQNITVNLEEFDSLNLRDLLDTVFRTQDDYNTAVKNKASLEAEQARAVKEAEAKRDNDLFVLESLKLGKTETASRSKTIVNECNVAVSSIKTQYAALIAEVDAQIEVFQKQMAEYDNSKVRQAQEQEKALNSERQLRQLEQMELTGKYEKKITDLQNAMDRLRIQNQEEIRKSVTEVQTKYQAEIDKLDPILSDPAAKAIVDAAYISGASKLNTSNVATAASVSDEKLLSAYENYQKYYNDYEYLNNKIAAIPQKHTIPTYVAANSKLVNQMGAAFTDATMNLYQKNVQLQKKLDDAKKIEDIVFTNLLTVSRATALVYSANSEDDIQIFVAERARSMVDEVAGAGAEMVIGKVSVKGRVMMDEDGVYRFHMGEDTEGNPIPLPVEISAVTPGIFVKLMNK